MALAEQLKVLVEALASSSAKPQVFAFFIQGSKPTMRQMVIPRHGGSGGE